MTALEQPCETCGTRFRDVLREMRRSEPERTIEVFRSLNEEQRIGIHSWLVGALQRPPLDKPTKTFDPLAAILDALAWDLSLATPDPLSPTFEYAGERYVMPLPHPRMQDHVNGIEWRVDRPGVAVRVQRDALGQVGSADGM